MGRSPCCSKVGLRRGPWSTKEDNLLTNYIQQHGEGQWRSLPKKAGLLRCGKSCRLRWMNYLRPGIKRGNISEDEEDLIVRLHRLLGNRWSLIAGRLPGRTDNEIKNHWNTHLRKKLKNTGLHHKPTKTKKATTVENKKEQKEIVNAEHEDCNEEELNDNNLINDTRPTKIKVYFPKPIRVSPQFSRINSFDSGTSDSDAAEKVVSAIPVAALFEEEEEEEDDFLGDGKHVYSDANMLEQVYYEYLQLL